MKKNIAIERDKAMTPGARLDWLAAARNFVFGIEKKSKTK